MQQPVMLNQQSETIKIGPRTMQLLPTSSVIHSKRKFRESKMRCRQMARMSNEMVQCIKNLERIVMKTPTIKFVSPVESETRKNRWMEFLSDAKRSFFTWKREINELSHFPSPASSKQEDKFLRMLSVTTRSLLNFLKGLEKYSLEIQTTSQGSGLLRGTVVLSHRLLYIISLHNILPSPKATSHVRAPSLEKEEEETVVGPSREDDTEIATSDLDSEVLAILHPEAVKKRFSRLVKKAIPPQPNKSSKAVKIFAPLKQKSQGRNADRSQHLPAKHGLQHTSADPPSRRIPLNETYDCGDASGIGTRKHKPQERNNPTLTQDFPDEKADVFLRAEEEESDKVSVSSASDLDQHKDVLKEMSLQIEDLSSRFSHLVNSSHKVDQFIVTASASLRQNQPARDISTNLSSTINRAKLSLQKTLEMDRAVLTPSRLELPRRGTAPAGSRKSFTNINKIDYDINKNSLTLNQKAPGTSGDFFRRSIHEEVSRQREEFWSSLVERNFIAQSSKTDATELIKDCIEEVNKKLAFSEPFEESPEASPEHPQLHHKEVRSEATQVGSSIEQYSLHNHSTDDDKVNAKSSYVGEYSTTEETDIHTSHSNALINAEKTPTVGPQTVPSSSPEELDVKESVISVDELNKEDSTSDSASDIEISISYGDLSSQKSIKNCESYSQDFASQSTQPSTSDRIHPESASADPSKPISDEFSPQDSSIQKYAKQSLEEMVTESSVSELSERKMVEERSS